ncbi:MAG: 5-formyltetrahydrofolate cyclo-ligase [Steroidobacteraceae bacterium]
MEGSPIPAPELPAPPTSPDWPAVRSWRVRLRQALIGRRLGLDGALRKTRGERARQRLLEAVDLSRFATLGVYWPVRGEIDVLGIATAHLARGGRVALPVVVRPSAPVEFWSWQPGVPMSRGVWNIPIPAQRELLAPEALIVPLVGFDARCYRLGYGGGYYDRTIAAAVPRPWCVGLGFEGGRLESIFPQPHDIPMDLIVTDGVD